MDAGRPVQYAGIGTGGGHSFVCDGYDNNDFFHFNWGWGGSSDGYFSVNALNPGSLGTGGGNGGFNSNQRAIIGIQPPTVAQTFDMRLYDYVTPSATTINYGQAFTVSGPKVLVYKTKKNYNDLVPVLLSEDKSEIISYPHPTDIKIGDKFQYPTKLHDGYLLDNRGIGLTVGFLKLTYEEFSKLQDAPSIKELYEMIIDKDPLSEMYDCGNRSTLSDLVNHFNDLIDEKKLTSETKKLK